MLLSKVMHARVGCQVMQIYLQLSQATLNQLLKVSSAAFLAWPPQEATDKFARNSANY